MLITASAGLLASPAAFAGDTNYAYDVYGRVTGVNYPDGTIVSYQYDMAGNRITLAKTKGNDAPVVSTTSLSSGYNTSGSVVLSASGVYTAFAVATNPTHGSASISGNTVSYVPTAGYYGLDSFTYTASGPGGTSAPATVNVTVANPPVPGVSAKTLSAAFNTPGTVGLSPTGVYTSVAVSSGPAHGAVVISGTNATYTPTAGYYGSDSFTFTATGPGGTSAPASVSVTVANPAAPTVSAATISTAYNTAGSVALSPSGVYTSLAVAASPAHGTATISGATATFTPTTGYYGADSFTYTATGPGGTSAPANVSVTVGNPPAPTVSAKSLTVGYNTAGTVALSPSGVYNSIAVPSGPSHGAVGISGGNATYTPTSGYYGADAFTFTATGPGGTSAAANVAVTVGNPPAPSAGNTSLTVAFATAGSVSLSPGGVYSAVALGTGPAHGSASVVGSTATYTPTAGFSGSDSFTYTVTGPGGTTSGTVTVTVQARPSYTLNVTAATNLRTLANLNGYGGAGNVLYNFVVPAGTTVLGSANGGAAIDTGTWPASVSLTLTVSGNVYGGGGNGGSGGTRTVGSPGGAGGDAITVQAPISVTINSGGTVKGGGGGGGGGGATLYISKYTAGGVGGGGGGGFPNGSGGTGSHTPGTTASNGAAGTVSGGGLGGTGSTGDFGTASAGGNGGAAATTGSVGATSVSAGGAGGTPGYAIRKNGNSVPVTNNGVTAGTVG